MLEAMDVTIAPAPTGERRHIGAIFDVDRTLLPDTTAERLFLRFLWRRGELGTRAALETARFAGRHVFAPQTIVQGVRRQRPYLRGKEAAAIERLGAECFDARNCSPNCGAGKNRVSGPHRGGAHHCASVRGTVVPDRADGSVSRRALCYCDATCHTRVSWWCSGALRNPDRATPIR